MANKNGGLKAQAAIDKGNFFVSVSMVMVMISVAITSVVTTIIPIAMIPITGRGVIQEIQEWTVAIEIIVRIRVRIRVII